MFLINSDWLPMRSLFHDALGQPPYSQISNPNHSVFTMAVAERTSERFGSGHCRYRFFELCDISGVTLAGFGPG